MSYPKIKTTSKISFIICLTLFFVLSMNDFYRKEDLTSVAEEQMSYVEGKAECVMEVNSRRILYASNEDLRLPMASTTKILTAITVLENCTCRWQAQQKY